MKTWLFTTMVVLTNVLGNFFMKRGLPDRLDGPLQYVAALFRPEVAFGVALLILWMLSRMALLSWADLSYVVPVTSIGYVLVALMGCYFLDERITRTNWAGIGMIAAGVSLVGLSSRGAR
jgi:drug/metabolite transporter (DMT)-like permease